MDLVVYDDDEKRYVPWAVALAGVLLVAALASALTFLLARQAAGDEGTQAISGVSVPAPATSPSAVPSASDDPAPPATGSATPTPTAAADVAPSQTAATSAAPATAAPACAAALLQADEVLQRSVALDEALAQHTQIMDELLAERIDAAEALDRTLPVLTEGATARNRFQQELAAYSDSRGECVS